MFFNTPYTATTNNKVWAWCWLNSPIAISSDTTIEIDIDGDAQISTVIPSWDCVNGACIDPGTGNGQYSSLAACQANPPCIPQIDPCAPIIASLDATMELIPSATAGAATAEVVFTGTTLPLGAAVSYNWYEGQLATHVTNLGSGISTGNYLNDTQGNPPFAPWPGWGTNGESYITGLWPGWHHVVVDTGDGCYRWFEFLIVI